MCSRADRGFFLDAVTRLAQFGSIVLLPCLNVSFLVSWWFMQTTVAEIHQQSRLHTPPPPRPSRSSSLPTYVARRLRKAPPFSRPLQPARELESPSWRHRAGVAQPHPSTVPAKQQGSWRRHAGVAQTRHSASPPSSKGAGGAVQEAEDEAGGAVRGAEDEERPRRPTPAVQDRSRRLVAPPNSRGQRSTGPPNAPRRRTNHTFHCRLVNRA